MKKSAILFELIISILILSIVGVYSVNFLSNLYISNSQNLKIINKKLDLETTNVFIENRLRQGVAIISNSNSISFYEVDINSFKSGYYSGFTQLEKSNKKSIFTPNSHISKIDASYIWFDNNHIYEIEKSFEDEKIYFKNKNIEKKIYEQYKLLTTKSKIYLKDNKLYFNNHILLKNIKSFDAKLSSEYLTINICDSSCQNWIIKL